MTVTQRIITFAASAQQFPAPTALGLIAKLHVEIMRSNTHVAFVGTSAVTNDSSGVGVISTLAYPAADTAAADRFVHEDQSSRNTIDPTQFYGHGTSGEKLKVTYFQV